MAPHEPHGSQPHPRGTGRNPTTDPSQTGPYRPHATKTFKSGEAGKHPVLAHLPFALVLAVVVVGLVRIVLYHWREGTVLIGAALVLAAAIRALLSDEQAGLIVIRGRGVDVLTYAGFGVCMMAVALTIEGGPLGS